jgi:RNA polymerase sigma-70 factor (ECF subfamily)
MVMAALEQQVSGVRKRTFEIEPSSPVKEGHLIDRARAGDEAAFEQLVAAHGKRVLSIAARFFRQPDVREDIAQEVFIKVYQSLDSFRIGEPFEPWLTRITLNACYDHLRQIQRRKELKLSEITEDETAWLERQGSALAMKTFEQDREREVAAGLAEKVFDTLSPDDRMALLLYERDGFSTAEIAQVLGWSRANVKVRLLRARRSLRRSIEELLSSTAVKRKT